MRTIARQIDGLKRDLARGGQRPNKVAEIEGDIERLEALYQSNPDGARAFKGRHQGRTCYIFGAGPSLNRFDCDKMAQDGVTICCNASIMALKSCDYFMFTDTRIMDDPYYPTVFDKADTVLVGNQTVYDACIGQAGPEVHHRVVAPSPESPRGPGVDCSADACQLISGEDVVHVATHLALIMGCSPIVLVGVDLEWGADEKYFHSRADKDRWPDIPAEPNEAADNSLRRSYDYWCEIKAANPGLPIFVANPQSRLCELYPSMDCSEFLK